MASIIALSLTACQQNDAYNKNSEDFLGFNSNTTFSEVEHLIQNSLNKDLNCDNESPKMCTTGDYQSKKLAGDLVDSKLYSYDFIFENNILKRAVAHYKGWAIDRDGEEIKTKFIEKIIQNNKNVECGNHINEKGLINTNLSCNFGKSEVNMYFNIVLPLNNSVADISHDYN